MHLPHHNGTSRIIVVVMREVLIARDIELIIGDVRPEVVVVTAQTIAEAASKIPQGAVVETVFVSMHQAARHRSDLGAMIKAHNGRVVLLDDEIADQASPPWSVLPFPFTRDHVLAHLIADPLT